jgi:hypothetical protein
MNRYLTMCTDIIQTGKSTSRTRLRRGYTETFTMLYTNFVILRNVQITSVSTVCAGEVSWLVRLHNNAISVGEIIHPRMEWEDRVCGEWENNRDSVIVVYFTALSLTLVGCSVLVCSATVI